MATPEAGRPYALIVEGEGTSSLAFKLPAGVHYDVESVLAHVDAGAAGATVCDLVIAKPSGVVIAAKRQGVPIPAGDTGRATWALRLADEAASSAAPAGASLPWALASEAGYVAGDYVVGRSPNPLSFRGFATTDPTAFAFVQTDNPTVGDGDVQIIRDGLYLVRLVISANLNHAASDPGYSWDLTVQAQCQDGGGRFFFGPDLFPFGAVVQPVSSYATYLDPRNQPGFPNGNSMLGRREQHPSTDNMINLPDPDVTWPAAVQGFFRHGLNDPDVTNAPQYNLWLMRLGDGNPAAADP